MLTSRLIDAKYFERFQSTRNLFRKKLFNPYLIWKVMSFMKGVGCCDIDRLFSELFCGCYRNLELVFIKQTDRVLCGLLNYRAILC
jgi:hypothetical protein